MRACNSNRLVKILDCQDLTNHTRHVDQVQFDGLGQSEDVSTVASHIKPTGLDTESK